MFNFNVHASFFFMCLYIIPCVVWEINMMKELIVLVNYNEPIKNMKTEQLLDVLL